ncbi:dephospho-CoA kinase [Haladaptatus paucihalophilus DX253]|uniref:Dephospho-CoA kinase n=1 Tax=Haladaptatus paucihalophilus DX253 TaxID=797209 RepID=E7QN20_HALPU|nr:AAA family ATPase [Haladaptatus paucihalophilus]EFW93815.1 dephospho-CoA kinase [Haladaptatus paucihalophilus DX253]SHL52001.1 Dephospho-CoA kinase [Haladaptatus paucihalophilus DX253]
MRVIGTVGLPGSGKGEAATVAEEMGIPVVTMGDVIRAACRERGLDPAEHHGEIAKALREENGPDAIAQASLPQIDAALTTSETVLVDGIRSGVEVERFEDAFGDDFVLVSIEAPFEVRADRLSERGRDHSDADEARLRKRDERELGFGLDRAMARADAVIDNTGTLDGFRRRIRALLEDGLSGLESVEAGENR